MNDHSHHSIVHGSYRNNHDDELREYLIHTKKEVSELKEMFSQFLKTQQSKKTMFRSRHGKGSN